MGAQSTLTISRHAAARLLALAACVFASSGVLATGVSAASAPLVTVKVAKNQTVDNLLYQQFVQNVTCRKECDVTTIVSISLGDAKKLGYKAGASSTSRVTVASSYMRVKANKPTSVGFVVSPEGRKLLPKAKSGLEVAGKLTVIPTGNRKTQSSAGWSTNLK